jgi:3',5'-cyclic AMP phosphodiesterase CpdA
MLTIAHISDLHCGGPHFLPSLLERALGEINDLRPDIVVCSGDLDHGQIGRGRYPWIEEQFAEPADLRIFMLHHHLLPVPGTGRERNIVYDAGDLIETLQRSRVNLVLSGHKHVPYAWRLENLFIVNAGTVSSMRVRGNTRQCYNVIEVDDGVVTVYRRYPFHGRERIIEFSLETLDFRKFTSRIEREVTSR